MQKRAARIFRISGLITSLDLEGLFSWRQGLETPSGRPASRDEALSEIVSRSRSRNVQHVIFIIPMHNTIGIFSVDWITPLNY